MRLVAVLSLLLALLAMSSVVSAGRRQQVLQAEDLEEEVDGSDMAIRFEDEASGHTVEASTEEIDAAEELDLANLPEEHEQAEGADFDMRMQAAEIDEDLDAHIESEEHEQQQNHAEAEHAVEAEHEVEHEHEHEEADPPKTAAKTNAKPVPTTSSTNQKPATTTPTKPANKPNPVFKPPSKPPTPAPSAPTQVDIGTPEPAVTKKTPAFKCSPAPIKDGKQLHPVRQRIVDTGMAYVLKIGDRGGKRYGADLLQDIYDTAYGADTAKWGWGPQIQGVGKKPNSWCGIFSVAIARKAGVRSARWMRWDAKPATCPAGLAAKLQPGTNFEVGDVLLIKDKPGKPPLNHHCICKSIKGDTIETIDGNSWDQKTGMSICVTTNTRRKSDVAGYYKTVPDPAWVPLKNGKADNCDKK